MTSRSYGVSIHLFVELALAIDGASHLRHAQFGHDALRALAVQDTLLRVAWIALRERAILSKGLSGLITGGRRRRVACLRLPRLSPAVFAALRIRGRRVFLHVRIRRGVAGRGCGLVCAGGARLSALFAPLLNLFPAQARLLRGLLGLREFLE